MTTILVDRDVEGQAVLLWDLLATEGWLDLVPLRRMTLAAAGLSINSPDRMVWRFAQAQGMLLITNNRNARGKDSLAQTIREETTPTTLPVLTIGNLDRLNEHAYRRRCAERIVEIVVDLERYLGTGRMFIP